MRTYFVIVRAGTVEVMVLVVVVVCRVTPCGSGKALAPTARRATMTCSMKGLAFAQISERRSHLEEHVWNAVVKLCEILSTDCQIL